MRAGPGAYPPHRSGHVHDHRVSPASNGDNILQPARIRYIGSVVNRLSDLLHVIIGKSSMYNSSLCPRAILQSYDALIIVVCRKLSLYSQSVEKVKNFRRECRRGLTLCCGVPIHSQQLDVPLCPCNVGATPAKPNVDRMKSVRMEYYHG